MALNDSQNFVNYVNRSLDQEEEYHFLRFEFLQRLSLAHFYVKLVRAKSQIQKDRSVSEDDLEELQITLRDYAAAIRDYKYLRGHKSINKSELRKRKFLLQGFFQSENDHNDPFHSHYAFFQDPTEKIDPPRLALMQHLPRQLTFSDEEKNQRPREFSEGKHPQQVSKFVDRMVRFIVAITGGIFLIVPMIVIMIHPSRTKSFVTVSIAVDLFALVLSFGMRVSDVETLIATATYAAVLVVFVGSSTGNNAF